MRSRLPILGVEPDGAVRARIHLRGGPDAEAAIRALGVRIARVSADRRVLYAALSAADIDRVAAQAVVGEDLADRRRQGQRRLGALGRRRRAARRSRPGAAQGDGQEDPHRRDLGRHREHRRAGGDRRHSGDQDRPAAGRAVPAERQRRRRGHGDARDRPRRGAERRAGVLPGLRGHRPAGPRRRGDLARHAGVRRQGRRRDRRRRRLPDRAVLPGRRDRAGGRRRGGATASRTSRRPATPPTRTTSTSTSDIVPGDDFIFPFDTHDFGSVAGLPPDIGWDGLVAGNGNFFAAFMQWNDPFGGSANDYDIYIFDADGDLAGDPASDFPIGGPGFDAQDGDDDPMEVAFVVNDFPGPTAVRRRSRASSWSSTASSPIRHAAGAAVQRVLRGRSGQEHRRGQHLRPRRQPRRDGRRRDRRGREHRRHAEPGPRRHRGVQLARPVADLLHAGRRRRAPEVRRKPNTTAVDGTSVTGVNFFTPFFGTSASAPHAAAVAVLLKDVDPGLGPAGIARILRETSLERGTPGFDTTWGFGLIDAFAAAKRAGQVGNSPLFWVCLPTKQRHPAGGAGVPDPGALALGLDFGALRLASQARLRSRRSRRLRSRRRSIGVSDSGSALRASLRPRPERDARRDAGVPSALARAARTPADRACSPATRTAKRAPNARPHRSGPASRWHGRAAACAAVARRAQRRARRTVRIERRRAVRGIVGRWHTTPSDPRPLRGRSPSVAAPLERKHRPPTTATAARRPRSAAGTVDERIEKRVVVSRGAHLELRVDGGIRGSTGVPQMKRRAEFGVTDCICTAAPRASDSCWSNEPRVRFRRQPRRELRSRRLRLRAGLACAEAVAAAASAAARTVAATTFD